MRGMFRCHIAAAAVMVATIGGTSAQPSDPIPQSQEAPADVAAQPVTSPATVQPMGPPPSDAAATPATPPETAAPAVIEPPVQEAKPATGLDLFQVPIANELRGSDATTAEKLRELLVTRLTRAIDRRQDRAGVEAFYRDRGFAPLWIADGAASSRAKAAIAYLRGVAADGLDPADYPIPAFSDPSKLALDEMALTNSVLAFARHARTGRLPYAKVSSAIHYDLENPEAPDVLANLANAGNPADALDAYQPQHPAYKALKAKLAEARKKPGALADTIIANLERWRWVPRDLGAAHVVVNIPDFTLKVVNEGRTAWTTKIVVGKVGNQATPLFSETMKYITVNPTWNVPPSIIRNEYMPALQRDPNALERIGLKVTHRPDGSVRIYQPPGERNALGRIRFNFPNRFLVYQHDTPDKRLFDHTTRAYSHGCMRVQNPEHYAEVLLSIAQPAERYTADRIRKMYGTRERTLKFPAPIPVHITYQTAYVDEAGQLQTRPDLYGHDKTMIGMLRGRSAAETPVARNLPSGNKPAAAHLTSRQNRDGVVRGQGRRADSPFWQQEQRIVRRSDPFFFGPPAYIGPPRRVYGAPY
jgi:murein L,D-transpeptidase YcbB/YkuD